MSTMDFASALGGGGPEMMGGPPPPAPPEEEPVGGEGFGNSLDALDAAEEALQAFIQLDPDEADRAIAAQALQTVIKLKAANQQSAQSGDMKSLARALQGGPGANAGPLGAALGG